LIKYLVEKAAKSIFKFLEEDKCLEGAFPQTIIEASTSSALSSHPPIIKKKT